VEMEERSRQVYADLRGRGWKTPPNVGFKECGKVGTRAACAKSTQSRPSGKELDWLLDWGGSLSSLRVSRVGSLECRALNLALSCI
jgi:hypothetical protein